MFVIANTIKVKKGFGDKLSARFGQVGHIDKVPGFLDLNLLQTRVTEDDCDEIVVWSKWISQKAHNEWVASDMFKKAHEGARADYILDSKITFYDVVGHKTTSIDSTTKNAI